MKKLLLVLVVAICLVALCACGEKAPEKEPEKEPVVVTPVSSGEITQEVVEPAKESGEPLNESGEVEFHYSEDLPDADTLINDLMNSEEYKKKSDKDKKVAVENMLNELVLRKEIKNLSYDESEQLFSFEYKNGTLGGVSLKGFDDKTN